jgi:hypothetical protein
VCCQARERAQAYKMPSVETATPFLKSKPVATDFSRLILMPDLAQKSATTWRRRDMSAADLVVSTRSSARPLAGGQRPEIVRWPTPVALGARSSALNNRPTAGETTCHPASAHATAPPQPTCHKAGLLDGTPQSRGSGAGRCQEHSTPAAIAIGQHGPLS